MASASTEKSQIRPRLRVSEFSPTLICAIALLFLSSFNYGLSNQAFASSQATDAFGKQFGDYKAKTHKYVLPALYLSLLNSIKSATQLIGKCIRPSLCFLETSMVPVPATNAFERCVRW